MKKVAKVNFSSQAVSKTPGPKVISYEEGLKRQVGGSEKSDGQSGALKGEVKAGAGTK